VDIIREEGRSQKVQPKNCRQNVSSIRMRRKQMTRIKRSLVDARNAIQMPTSIRRHVIAPPKEMAPDASGLFFVLSTKFEGEYSEQFAYR
jgi:hypothetical protein